MNGTATHQWTIIYEASHQSYVEDKLSKNTIFDPPIQTPKDLTTKVEKPMYGTKLYHHTNFHANWHEISVPEQKIMFFLIGDSRGWLVSHAIHF